MRSKNYKFWFYDYGTFYFFKIDRNYLCYQIKRAFVLEKHFEIVTDYFRAICLASGSLNFADFGKSICSPNGKKNLCFALADIKERIFCDCYIFPLVIRKHPRANSGLDREAFGETKLFYWFFLIAQERRPRHGQKSMESSRHCFAVPRVKRKEL